jgi:hypothetical protein
MSRNLLLIVNFRLRAIEEFEEIKQKYVKYGYDIYEEKNINNREFKIELLQEILERAESDKYERIVLISNIRDALFCWYRIYNSFIDDFIFFIDKYNYRLLKEDIYEQLSNFTNISSENLEGKIYINLKSWNFEIVKEILVNPKNFYKIGLLDFIDIKYTKNKKMIINNYEYNGEKLKLNGSKNNYRSLNKQEDKIFIQEIYDCLNIRPEIIPYYFVFSYRNNNNLENLNALFVRYFYDLKKIEVNLSATVIERIILVIDKGLFDFKDGIDVLFFCSFFKEINIDIGDKILEYISNDTKYKETHYSCLINLFFITYGEKIRISKEFYKKMATEIIKLGESYNIETPLKETPLKQIKINKIKKVAIVVDQLMAPKHSTAKATLDYAINIKKLYGYDVEIFVEDNFYNDKSIENFMIYNSNSEVSSKIRKAHISYLKEAGVEIPIFYSDVQKSKKERVKDSLNIIFDYNPDVVININNAYSLLMNFVSKSYNSYYLTLGLINWQDNQIYNFYFNGIKEELLPKDKNNIIMETKAVTFENKEKIYTREQFGFENNDFIMVAVSLMPGADFTEEFLENIIRIIKKYQKLKFIIVGTEKINFINDKYKELINSKIKFIKYEQNLGALYQICDIYINPPRDGGGYSIAEAMFYGLPIVNIAGYRAGDSWVGIEGSINSIEEYLLKLERLYNDKNYYSQEKTLTKQRIESLNFKSHLEEILSFIKI